MAEKNIKVHMLGDFSVEYDGKTIDDNSNRSHKVWLLLAYVIYNSDRTVSQDELIKLLWSGKEHENDPRGALKAIFYRIRVTLDQLGEFMGHNLIFSTAGVYFWNKSYTIDLDCDRFKTAAAEAFAETEEQVKLEKLIEAIDLYEGPFLSKLEGQSWVSPVAAEYKKIYIEAVKTCLAILETRNQFDTMLRVSKAAIVQDPLNELFYTYYMKALIKLDDRKTAISAYEELRDLLSAEKSVAPCDEVRALYHEATRTINSVAVSPEVITAQLTEANALSGALICEYDFFKFIYRQAARSIERTGASYHLVIMTITGDNNSELPKRSLDRAMDNLQEQIRLSLRRGDTAARCSGSQFVIMLPFAGYEDSCVVAKRVMKAFETQYPHSPAELHYWVQAVEAGR